jgi:hypothetical protein
LLYSDIQKKLILLLFIDCLFSHTSCSVTDADLMQLSQIQEVKDLDLSNTQITDTVRDPPFSSARIDIPDLSVAESYHQITRTP